jgi:hypothetical protein
MLDAETYNERALQPRADLHRRSWGGGQGSFSSLKLGTDGDPSLEHSIDVIPNLNEVNKGNTKKEEWSRASCNWT